jgi:hypothetical protein
MPTPTVTFIPATATLTLPTSTPTEIPTPTEIVETIIIDVTKPSSEWDLSSLPEEKRTAIEHWLADPYTSIPKEKQIADDFLKRQWQLTLKTEVTGHDLYERIVAYDQSKGGEVGLLPNSLHLLERTDKDNMVVYAAAPGMDKYVHTSWYGFDANGSNHSFETLESVANLTPEINFYGLTVKRESSIYPITSINAIEGDLVVIYKIPGSHATGVILKLIDEQGKSRYAEGQVQLDNRSKTSDVDRWMIRSGNKIIPEVTTSGVRLPTTEITPYDSQAVHNILTHEKLIDLVNSSENGAHIMIDFTFQTATARIYAVWQNGAYVITSVIDYSPLAR